MPLDVVHPAAHIIIVEVDERGVAIVEVGAPGGLDDEALPVGAAAGAEGRGHVGQVARAVQRILPSPHPLAVGVAHIPKGLQGVGRRVAVAAVAHALYVRAVDHIATESEAAEGVLHHVVDGVQPWVGALEGGTA